MLICNFNVELIVYLDSGWSKHTCQKLNTVINNFKDTSIFQYFLGLVAVASSDLVDVCLLIRMGGGGKSN